MGQKFFKLYQMHKTRDNAMYKNVTEITEKNMAIRGMFNSNCGMAEEIINFVL